MCEVAMHCKGLPPLILALATTAEAKKVSKDEQKEIFWHKVDTMGDLIAFQV